MVISLKITNAQAADYIQQIYPFLERRDIIGYAAARNTRILRNAIVEYESIRDKLIQQYGQQEFDDSGEPTGRYIVQKGSDEFKKIRVELTRLDSIQHEVSILKIPYKDVIGILSGSEILDIDWMLEDSDDIIER